MSTSDLHKMAFTDETTSINAVGEELTSVTKKGGKQESGDTKPQRLYLQAELSADRVSAALQGMSENSCDELDGLMRDLQSLREKLVSDGERIGQEIGKFARFSQSVIKLTEVVSTGVVQVQANRSPGE